MVALDFTMMDQTLIQYTSFLSGMLKPDRIYFINVQRDLEIPLAIKQEYPQFKIPRDEQLKKNMKSEVAANFKNHSDYDIDYKIAEGHEIQEMLHWSKVKNIDLLVVGRKNELKGSGHIAQHITRKIMCSVLMVPESPNYEIKEIFVPIDFSENSVMAVEEALRLAENDPETTIYVQHVYHLPIGYYSTGKSEHEFAEIMKKNVLKEYNEFIAGFDTQHAHITPVFELDLNHSTAEFIYKCAHRKKTDLIIIGARGRTLAASIFLGSTTEKLIKMDSDIPILIVKSKNNSVDFLEMLKKI